MNKYALAIAMSLVTLSAGAVTRGGIAVPGNYNYFNPVSGTGLFAKDLLAGVDPAGVTFTYQITTSYSGECTWANHVKERFPIVHTDGATVNSDLSYINGAHRVFNGYTLAGFGTTFSSGAKVPVVGSICKKGAKSGTWTAVDVMSSDAGLYANYGATKTLLNY